ncbi:MAG: DUF3127 domain-containing protein [Bacteroidota bacterium]
MEITGRIIEILPAQTGTSQKGEWKRQDFILETNAQFPKKVCFANWNDKVNLSFDTSQTVKVFFDIESREFNGRWYTDVKPWKMEIVGSTNQAGNYPPADAGFPEPPPLDNDLDGDLPF